MSELFVRDLDVARIVKGIELALNTRIDPSDTLLIFDEIQETPKALASLKYFCENAPEYHIVSAGSLLGVALHEGTSFPVHEGTSFPVGKVDFLDLRPLSFREFLCAVGKGNLSELLETGDFALANAFGAEYIDRLSEYCFVGGMPEAVAGFALGEGFRAVRGIPKRILDAYELDFSKHAPMREVPRIRAAWNSVPSQLAKENKKFVYGLLRDGARAKDFEMALMWLSDCGLIHKISRVAKPGMPLKAYEDNKAFKVYFTDVGLLACATDIDAMAILRGASMFTEFKGALAEQYVCQQLRVMDGVPVYYWTNDGASAEIDFVIQAGGRIIPIEVKADLNLQAKSLRVYREKYEPDVAVRVSMAEYRRDGKLINLPLWAVDSPFFAALPGVIPQQ